RYFGALTQDADRTIADYVFSRNAWHSLVGLDYVLRHQPEILKDWHRVPTSDANKQIVGRYLRQNGHQSSVPDMLFPANHGENLMYTTLEKTILLRGVVLFKDMPADEIFHVAQITEEKRITAGDVLFHEGDPGDSLYIVVEGSLRVHIGSQELAVFKKGDALGEMALFDNLPRSATATALEDTTLLR